MSDLSDFYSQLAGVREPIETALTLPAASYTSDAVLARERDAIFSQTWVAVGRADRWPATGDFSALDIAGESVIVLRDSEQRIRAYANTCRHRGAKLLSGSGHCRVVLCPFHAWSYGLDGRLVMAPRMQKTPGFDPTQHGLHEFHVQTHAGFVFVCLNPDPPELESVLGDFDSLHMPWELETLVTTRREEFLIECNWKLFLEVFNEYYHLPIVHSNTVDALYAEPEPTDTVSGNYTTQFGLTQGSSALLEDQQDKRLPAITTLDERQRNGTRYTWLFPNLTFAAGSEAIWILEALPVDAHRSQVAMTTCFPADTIARRDFDDCVSHYYARFDAAMAEDIPALENQQQGLGSNYAQQGRFSDLEPSVANFACWYAKQMQLPV